jgi:hypothetical protein
MRPALQQTSTRKVSLHHRPSPDILVLESTEGLSDGFASGTHGKENQQAGALILRTGYG